MANFPAPHPDDYAKMEMLLDRLISGDPGMFKYGDPRFVPGNMTDPRNMDALRQVMGRAKRGQLTPEIARAASRLVLEAPRFTERIASRRAGEIAADPLTASAGEFDYTLRKQVQAGQELARRKEILKRMLALLKRAGKGGALGLGLAALAPILGMFSGQSEADTA